MKPDDLSCNHISAIHTHFKNTKCNNNTSQIRKQSEFRVETGDICTSPNSPRLMLPPQVRVMLQQHQTAEANAKGATSIKDQRSQRAKWYSEQAVGLVANPDALSLLLADADFRSACIALYGTCLIDDPSIPRPPRLTDDLNELPAKYSREYATRRRIHFVQTVLEYQEHGPELSHTTASHISKSVRNTACLRLQKELELQNGSLYHAFSLIDHKCAGRVTITEMRRGLLNLCKGLKMADPNHDIGIVCACVPSDWENKVSLRDFCSVFGKQRNFLAGTQSSRQRTDEREQRATAAAQKHQEETAVGILTRSFTIAANAKDPHATGKNTSIRRSSHPGPSSATKQERGSRSNALRNKIKRSRSKTRIYKKKEKNATDKYIHKTKTRHGALSPLRDDKKLKSPKTKSDVKQPTLKSICNGTSKHSNKGNTEEIVGSDSVKCENDESNRGEERNVNHESEQENENIDSELLTSVQNRTNRRGSTSSDPGGEAAMKFRQGVRNVQKTIIKPQLTASLTLAEFLGSMIRMRKSAHRGRQTLQAGMKLNSAANQFRVGGGISTNKANNNENKYIKKGAKLLAGIHGDDEKDDETQTETFSASFTVMAKSMSRMNKLRKKGGGFGKRGFLSTNHAGFLKAMSSSKALAQMDLSELDLDAADDLFEIEDLAEFEFEDDDDDYQSDEDLIDRQLEEMKRLAQVDEEEEQEQVGRIEEKELEGKQDDEVDDEVVNKVEEEDKEVEEEEGEEDDEDGIDAILPVVENNTTDKNSTGSITSARRSLKATKSIQVKKWRVLRGLQGFKRFHDQINNDDTNSRDNLDAKARMEGGGAAIPTETKINSTGLSASAETDTLNPSSKSAAEHWQLAKWLRPLMSLSSNEQMRKGRQKRREEKRELALANMLAAKESIAKKRKCSTSEISTVRRLTDDQAAKLIRGAWERCKAYKIVEALRLRLKVRSVKIRQAGEYIVNGVYERIGRQNGAPFFVKEPAPMARKAKKKGRKKETQENFQEEEFGTMCIVERMRIAERHCWVIAQVSLESGKHSISYVNDTSTKYTAEFPPAAGWALGNSGQMPVAICELEIEHTSSLVYHVQKCGVLSLFNVVLEEAGTADGVSNYQGVSRAFTDNSSNSDATETIVMRRIEHGAMGDFMWIIAGVSLDTGTTKVYYVNVEMGALSKPPPFGWICGQDGITPVPELTSVKFSVDTVREQLGWRVSKAS